METKNFILNVQPDNQKHCLVSNYQTNYGQVLMIEKPSFFVSSCFKSISLL